MWYDHKGRYDHNVLTPGRTYSIRLSSETVYATVEVNGWFDQVGQGFKTRNGLFIPIETLDAIKLSFREWLKRGKWGTNLKTTEKYLGIR
jgi:hypothetical protein